MKKFKTWSDMGCIKIFSNDLSLFFSNDIGDGGNIVKIYKKEPLIEDKKGKKNNILTFLGHFTVKEKDSVWLSEYDCSNKSLYCFDIGRWFVSLSGNCEFFIYKIDEELHS